MLSRSAMALVTALLMFPQIAETIYSPALTDISAHFSVSAADAAQTLAVYFIGFAVGVLFWGWMRGPLAIAAWRWRQGRWLARRAIVCCCDVEQGSGLFLSVPVCCYCSPAQAYAC